MVGTTTASNARGQKKNIDVTTVMLATTAAVTIQNILFSTSGSIMILAVKQFQPRKR